MANNQQKELLIAKLQEIVNRTEVDCEIDHVDADQALLEFINDPAVSRLFKKIHKHYS